MPAGCDFSCTNEECEYTNTGFTITGPWPMGEIDYIISCDKVKDMPEFQAQLKQLKEAGREHVCIAYPNTNEIETKKYRITLWSPEASCMWNYDIDWEEGQSVSEAVQNASLPTECPATGCNLLDYRQVIEAGIKCPHCSKELKQTRWFTQEK